MKQYAINEIFYSIQGEGLRAGMPHVFVRFAACNLKCSTDGEAGFDCDTEFTSGRLLTANQILEEIAELGAASDWIVLTGGEPALQVDSELTQSLLRTGYGLAIETNGTKQLPEEFDFQWVCCSPKTAEHTLRLRRADELKYVRRKGQGVPKPTVKADHYLISPAVQPDGSILAEDLAWCIQLVKENPTWRLSVQQHKQWGIR